MQFNFTNYIKENDEIKNEINLEFFEWFIGFLEGEGCFHITNRNDLIFVITQSTIDIQVLNYIRDELNFGKVVKQNENTSRFVIQDIKNIRKILLICNGNIILPKRQAQFKLFLENYNNKIKQGKIKHEYIPYKTTTCKPAITNGWISGFTDGEGCFSVSFLSNSNAFRIRYIVTQKGDENLPVLSNLINVFKGGHIEKHAIKSVYSYIISGYEECFLIFEYFKKYPLKTKKLKSYKAWCEMHKEIGLKNHLDITKREKLKELAAQINKN